MSEDLMESLRLIHARLSLLEDRLQGPQARPGLGAPEDEGRVVRQGRRETWRKDLPGDPNHRKGGKYEPPDVNSRRYSGKEMERIKRQLNEYWEYILQVNPRFDFSEEQVKYVTTTEVLLEMSVNLNRIFSRETLDEERQPVVVDLFAGTLLDAITMAYELRAQEIHASDLPLSGADEHDYAWYNLQRFKEVAPDKTTPIYFKRCSASEFFTQLKQTSFGFDLLYLDPPWSMPGQSKEMDHFELLDFLVQEVFNPMFYEGFKPHVIVIKTRFAWDEMEAAMKHLKSYQHVETLAFTPYRRTVHYHVMISRDYREYTWVPSEVFSHVYKGKSLPPGERRRLIPDQLPSFKFARVKPNRLIAP